MKHCKVAYIEHAGEELGDLVKMSYSFDFETEEEMNRKIELNDKEINEGKWKPYYDEKVVKIYSEEELINELEEELKDLIIVNYRKYGKKFIIETSKGPRYFINGIEASKSDYVEYYDDKESDLIQAKQVKKNGKYKYYINDTEVTKDTFESYLREQQKASKKTYISALRKIINDNYENSRIKRLFDTSKLTVDDYEICKAVFASSKKDELSDVNNAIEYLKEKFAYAIRK